MAESVEKRLSSLEAMCAKMFCEQHALKMLSMALFLENKNSAEVCGGMDFLEKMFSEASVFEPIPDSLIDSVSETLKFYKERLAILGEAVEKQRNQKR